MAVADIVAAKRLAWTAAGAAGSVVVGAILAPRRLPPRLVAGTLAVFRGGLSMRSENEALQALGSGAMSGSGAKRVGMLLSDRVECTASTKASATSATAPSGPRADAAVTSAEVGHGVLNVKDTSDADTEASLQPMSQGRPAA